MLFGNASPTYAAVSNVSFSGASQVAYAQTTWTVSFRISSALSGANTVTVVFPAGFAIPAVPTIALTAGFVTCSATGATTGAIGAIQTVTASLTNNGGTCALASGTIGTLTIAGIVNPAAARVAKAGFTVKTSVSSNTTAVADGNDETIDATTRTITSITPSIGTTAGGTSVTIAGTNLGSTTLVTFGGVAGTSLVNVNSTTVTVTTPAGTAGAQDVVLSGTSGGQNSAAGFTYATAPSAPTITAITPSNGSLSVAFTAGATGGSAITSYKYSTDGGSTFFTSAAGTTASPFVLDPVCRSTCYEVNTLFSVRHLVAYSIGVR